MYIFILRMAEIRRKFVEYDVDGNGQVSVEEAHDILRRELAFTPEQSIQLVKRYDKNGDGQLSYEEFVKFYFKVKSKYDFNLFADESIDFFFKKKLNIRSIHLKNIYKYTCENRFYTSSDCQKIYNVFVSQGIPDQKHVRRI